MPDTKTIPLLETNLPDVALLARGKVRDIYDLEEHLLFVANLAAAVQTNGLLRVHVFLKGDEKLDRASFLHLALSHEVGALRA